MRRRWYTVKSVNANLLICTINVHLILGDQGPPGVKGIQNRTKTKNIPS